MAVSCAALTNIFDYELEGYSEVLIQCVQGITEEYFPREFTVTVIVCHWQCRAAA